MGKRFNYENLEITKLALELIDLVFKLADKVPKEEKFILADHPRRAVLSILFNIAEGSGKFSKQDYARFIRNSIGSLLEVDVGLVVALRRKYISPAEKSIARQKIEQLYFKLIAFEKAYR